MDEKEVINLLTGEKELSQEDKLKIMNWWIKERAPNRIATYDADPAKREFHLKDMEVTKIITNKDKLLLEYSIIKIKEDLNIIPKSGLSASTYLMGFR